VTKIYIVVGQTGEWDDHHEWDVIGYLDPESARKHAEAATREAHRLGCGPGDVQTDAAAIFKAVDEHQNCYDPGMHCDYTGTGYSVRQLNLEEGVFKALLDEETPCVKSPRSWISCWHPGSIGMLRKSGGWGG
jgi:hypothetical protein